MKQYYIILIVFVLFFSCQKKGVSYFDKISNNDILLPPPQQSDWRYNHIEKNQSFIDFKNSKKITTTKSKNIIYLQPIGEFNNLQQVELENVREYLEIFYQLKTKILPTITDSIFPKKARRISKEGQEQILASYILENVLIKEKNPNQVVLMGITSKDIYPKEGWNFVFGLASYENGVGVTSIYRFAEGNLNASNYNKSLVRLMKISSHEIGHMFGLRHCLHANCVMNGTNGLSETDFHTTRLCSFCQRKLNSSLDYNNEKRLLELFEYFKSKNLKYEVVIAKKDQDWF